MNERSLASIPSAANDISDPKKDQEKLKPEETEIELPDELIVTGNDTDISPEELSMLEGMDGFEASADNQNLADSSLDGHDSEGEELNVKSFGTDPSGDDLDVAITRLDDTMEEIGEEDEENNLYSPDAEHEENPGA